MQPRESERSGQDYAPPRIELPKGGGAIRALGETFEVNPSKGTASLTVPLPLSRGRSAFDPSLTLRYDSGTGNGPFGLGWSLSVPEIARSTARGVPKYGNDTDRFLLSGAEELVPLLEVDAQGDWLGPVPAERVVGGIAYKIDRFRPRTEGLFSKIERWCRLDNPAEVFWRTISRDNITSWFGRTPDSRIADPEETRRHFAWRLCESSDGRGNAITYTYATETAVGVALGALHEAQRSPAARTAQRYLKHVRYANAVPYLPALTPDAVWPPLPGPEQWHMELCFDYGDMDPETPRPSDALDWPARPDPFSTYRAGFEIRTYRLCRRVLMFHHFPEEARVGRDCLVRSLGLDYDTTETYARPARMTESAYRRRANQGFDRRDRPALELDYSGIRLDETVHEVAADALANLPEGVAGRRARWVDLDGDASGGVLVRGGSHWLFARNESLPRGPDGRPGAAALGPLRSLDEVPSRLRAGGALFLDHAGDGALDVAVLERPAPGFYERTAAKGWQPHRGYNSLPVTDWGDPHLRLADLTGDGLADLVVADRGGLRWHPSLGEAGYGAARPLRFEGRDTPPEHFAAGPDRITEIGDLSGDGLGDFLSIANGEIAYWPSLGHGRFGPCVLMDNAPWFDTPDQFDPGRIRLADVDGSGTLDILYLGADGVQIYTNLSGNGWSGSRTLRALPPVDGLAAVDVLDLLGNGTACLVFSLAHADAAGRQLRYVDLMGGTKPHLLIGVRNGLGAESRIRYAPSTQFYVADRRAGRHWLGGCPFVVHVVDRVETFDHVSRNRFVSSRSYHHGHFDGEEREFCGFAAVEMIDTEEIGSLREGGLPEGENFSAESYVPPVRTRTWLHTGLSSGQGGLSARLAEEYWRPPGPFDPEVARLLPDTVLPGALSLAERREAVRALRGAVLRQEVFALDDTAEAAHPYLVTEYSYDIQLVQPRGPNRHAVFFRQTGETVETVHDRIADDPRVSHSMTLETDGFGNVLLSATIAYGRRRTDLDLTQEEMDRQSRILATCGAYNVTAPVAAADAHRAPTLCEARAFEITGIELGDAERFSRDDLRAAISGAAEIPFHRAPTFGTLERRLLQRARTIFRADDLSGPLPFGMVGAFALPFRRFDLALTDAHIAAVYGDRVGPAMLAEEGRYVQPEGAGDWWIQSGQMFFSANPDATPAEELAEARGHFYLPRRYRDAFGADTSVTHDAYDLVVLESVDPVNNRITVGTRGADGSIVPAWDYRVMAPRMVSDPNGNRTEVAYDIFGLVAGVAVRGKPGESLGDALDGFEPDLAQEDIDAFFADPRGPPAAVVLAGATRRIVYDPAHPSPEEPGYAASIARERHGTDALPGGRLQVSFAYFDGYGRVVQERTMGDPDPGDGRPRWVSSGWTIFNNKGEPIRQFDPFFADGHEFVFAPTAGPSAILFYDPIGRAVATLSADRSWAKVIYHPWRQESWDGNDTVLVADPAMDPEVGRYFARLDPDSYLPGWHAARAGGELGEEAADAAAKAAAHAGTPAVLHLDVLGRPFLAVDNAGTGGLLRTRTDRDAEGQIVRIVDARGNPVTAHVVTGPEGEVPGYDLLGRTLYEESMDAGIRRVLPDVAGDSLRSWDARGHVLRPVYDGARRQTHLFMTRGTEAEILVERTVYGETLTDPELRNLRGQVFRQYDPAGMAESGGYDFKGNLVEARRSLSRAYRNIPDWTPVAILADPVALDAATEGLLEAESFLSAAAFDALDRPVATTAPDGSVTLPVYGDSGRLGSLSVRLRGSDTATTVVREIHYTAAGERERIVYETSDRTGVETRQTHDRDSLRLARIETVRLGDGRRLQDLFLTFDPVGNLTSVRDAAQQTVFFDNSQVDPLCNYIYDALYRLVRAEGREHAAQNNLQRDGAPFDPVTPLPFANSPEALQRYVEEYEHDPAGNLLGLRHRSGGVLRWHRRYDYEAASNRLRGTSRPEDAQGTFSGSFAHDAHGNMTVMPGLERMRWDHKDQLAESSRQAANAGTPETTYYVYAADGTRLRKATERFAPDGAAPTRSRERIYLGVLEIEREYDGSGVALTAQRESLHVQDGLQRIALVDTETVAGGTPVSAPQPVIRFQLTNHLDTAVVELDALGRVLTYEEFHPFGSTAYFGSRSVAEASRKRYRFGGRERDAESGFSLHGVRYYAAWLGRWVSADPAGAAGGLNLYAYAEGSPVVLQDPGGTKPKVFAQGETISAAEFDSAATGDSRLAADSIALLLPGGRGEHLITPTSAVKYLGPDAPGQDENHIAVDITDPTWRARFDRAAKEVETMRLNAEAAQRIMAPGRLIEGMALFELSLVLPGARIFVPLLQAEQAAKQGDDRTAFEILSETALSIASQRVSLGFKAARLMTASPGGSAPRGTVGGPRSGHGSGPPKGPGNEGTPAASGGAQEPSYITMGSGISGSGLRFRERSGSARLQVGKYGPGNVAAAEIPLKDGVKLRVRRANTPNGNHAEVHLINELRRRNIDLRRVTKFYSDYEFCTKCTALVGANFPNAGFYYNTPYMIVTGDRRLTAYLGNYRRRELKLRIRDGLEARKTE